MELLSKRKIGHRNGGRKPRPVLAIDPLTNAIVGEFRTCRVAAEWAGCAKATVEHQARRDADGIGRKIHNGWEHRHTKYQFVFKDVYRGYLL
jgi:hypothetical protein